MCKRSLLLDVIESKECGCRPGIGFQLDLKRIEPTFRSGGVCVEGEWGDGRRMQMKVSLGGKS